MTTTGLSVFDTTVQKSMKIVDDVSMKANIYDRHKAFQALRATLQTLRDRLPVNEAVHLAAQLPVLLTGFYYENWKPSSVPKKDCTKDEFLDHIRSYMQDVDPRLDAEHSARAVFAVLSKNVSAGEIDEVKQALPKELRDLWEKEATKSS
ncbi:MAG TPA: DUF2267 domain-containing protein [Balneolaceae bacterium]